MVVDCVLLPPIPFESACIKARTLTYVELVASALQTQLPLYFLEQQLSIIPSNLKDHSRDDRLNRSQVPDSCGSDWKRLAPGKLSQPTSAPRNLFPVSSSPSQPQNLTPQVGYQGFAISCSTGRSKLNRCPLSSSDNNISTCPSKPRFTNIQTLPRLSEFVRRHPENIAYYPYYIPSHFRTRSFAYSSTITNNWTKNKFPSSPSPSVVEK